MKKIMLLLGTLGLLACILAGCGSQSTASGKNVKIFLTLNAMDTFRQTLVDAASERASQEGVQLDIADAEDVIENQVAQIKSAAEQGYDVILCGAVSTDTTVELKATAGEIPIIFFNSCPNEKHLSEGQYVYVGSDEKVAGQLQAEYVLKQFADKDEINVVLLKGPNSHSATIGRTSGVKQALKASGKKINYVFEDSANWDTEQAKTLFELFLQTGSPVDCVICNNDSMALGVVEACKDNGIDPGSLPILGVDATADGCAAIQSGEMAFTVYQSGVGQGQAAIDMAIRMARQSGTEDMEGITEDGMYVWVPFEAVDSSNVAQYQ
ncbi:MAG: sugar ABC transporter substrate-binding protein [Lachnospiraceae bacterium]|nr:sugar ABC transporter substrate-binding protein [Lachnospiraceae bacterium]